MKNNKRLIFVIILLTCMLLLLVVSSYFYITDSNRKEKATSISVIVYGSDSDRWSTLKQGLDQGAADFKVELNFVTMASENDVEEQETLIAREIENGAQGIILAVAGSMEMTEAVKAYSFDVPFVLVETGIEDYTYISADNYSMGLNIGRSVYLNSEQKKTVAIFMNNLQRNSVEERYEGLMDSLHYTGYTIKTWEMGDFDTDPSLFLQKMLKEDPADVVIAMDDKSLEAVVDAAEATESTIDIYGIGSTNKIVHYLDYGVIDAIVFQNEFNMGYLSMQELMYKINTIDDVLDIDIEFRTVNKETMYLPKNQRLVFPIVQ